MTELSMAVNLFSKNVHDESLPSSIQTMSCKLLLNLVDCIRQKSEQENGNVSFFIGIKHIFHALVLEQSRGNCLIIRF